MKAVLLDFNGTLYNDTRFHIEAWRNFFSKYHGLYLSESEIIKRCIGPGNMDIFLDFFGDTLSDESKKQMSELKEKEYRAAARKKLELKRGVPEFLDFLKRNNIPYALATASPIENVEFYLHEIGLEKWFDYSNIVYDDGTIKGKPDPAFYIEAARRLNVSPKECLICEDSMTGIKAAICAGAGRLVVLAGTTAPETLAEIDEIYAVAEDFVGFEKHLK